MLLIIFEFYKNMYQFIDNKIFMYSAQMVEIF